MNNVLLIAHRGLFDNINIVENTIDAFKKCVNEDIPFELDVQLTLDHKVVVFHDDDLLRLAHNSISIQNSTYDELKKIKLLDTNNNIPLFSDVLHLNNDKVFIDIEVKDTKNINDTIFYLMKELEGYHNYSIKSFNPKIIRYIKLHYPFVKCGLLISKKFDSFITKMLYSTPFIIMFSKADFLSINKSLVNTKRYLKLSKKYPIQVWTIKDSCEISNNKYTYVCNKLPFIKD